MRIVPAALLAAAVLCAGLPAFGQTAATHKAERAANTRPNIILISIDTLRADRLRSGSPSAQATPNIDKLLRDGTYFSQETSLVPLTLPSHVALFTSTYPFVNGVEDNAERLAPGAVTLANTLRAHGYKTAAFLGSFVLDKRFGLDQGFTTYNAPSGVSRSEGGDAGDIKRKGEEVAHAGEAWLDTQAERPFFLFLHLYDLHTPYNLSAAEEAKYGKGYNGELAYIDHVIGNVWDYLIAHDLVKNSLIVLTSDHGEGLGDHSETTHGFFIYQSTLHVPLMIHWPVGLALLPARVDTPVSLLDLSPTLLDAVKLAVPTAMQGTSMLKTNRAPSPVFSESVYPQRHFGASSLSALRRGHYKYIEAPRPEFYDLAQDPGELNNLFASQAAVASAYRERLVQLRAQYQPHAQTAANKLSPEAIERLHALGYLTGGSAAPSAASKAVDPKDRIGDYEAYGRAIVLASLGHVGESNAALQSILARDPGLSDVRLTLGLNQQRSGNDREALQQFSEVLKVEPESAIAHLDAGLSRYNLRQFDAAENELHAALAISPDYAKAEIWLAKTLAEKGRLDLAVAEFNKVLEQTPDSYEAHDGLGTLAAMRSNWPESEKQLQAALEINPAAAETHNTLGNVYLRQGQTSAARQQFEEALRLKPNYAAAHYDLGLTLIALKDMQGARDEFSRALQADPNYLPASEALARLSKTP